MDYILASSDSAYKYVPGSYSVVSSKGTSDHHIVKVEMKRVGESAQEIAIRQRRKIKQKVVRITNQCYSRGLWQLKP